MPESVERAFERHAAFERVDDGYEYTTTTFEAVATASDVDAEGRDGAFGVTVRMPTLDAAVEGETVADVVEEGWFETLELRLEDAFDVARTSDFDDPDVSRVRGDVVVSLSFLAWNADGGVDDVKTIVDYVEGTYAQGIIPGYTYRSPVADIVERAMVRGDGDDGPGGPQP